MGFGICGHRFRRSPFTNKIFYIYKSPESLLTPLVFCFELRLVAAGHAAVARAALRSSCRAVSSARFASLRFPAGGAPAPFPAGGSRGLRGPPARPPGRLQTGAVPVPVQPVFNCAVALPGFILCGRGFISIMLNVFNT